MRWRVIAIVVGLVLVVGAVAAVRAQSDRQSIRDRIVTNLDPQVQIFTSGTGAHLGVYLRDLDADTAKQHKLASGSGVLIERVEPGSPAEKAGLKADDVITEFDGERARSVAQLRRLIIETPPGQSVKIAALRDGKRIDVSATPDRADSVKADELDLRGLLERNPDISVFRGTPRDYRLFEDGPLFTWRSDRLPRVLPRIPDRSREPSEPYTLIEPFLNRGAGRLGVGVQELTPQLSEYFNAKDGVLVNDVEPDSAASKAGLKAGDVVTAVNGKAVRNGADLSRFVREAPEGQTTVEIVRDRKPQTLKVTLGSRRGSWTI